MQELENILKEIEKIGNIKFASYTKPLITVEDVIKIIRKHMNENVATNDLISRQALLDDFRNTITENSDTFDWLNMIARQPIVNKGDDWIPVEEQLPEVCGKYWATIRYNDGRISEPIVVISEVFNKNTLLIHLTAENMKRGGMIQLFEEVE